MVDGFPQARVVLNHLGICPGQDRFSVDEWGRPKVDTSTTYNPARHTTWRLYRYENVAVLLSGQYVFSREAFPYRDLADHHQTLVRYFGAERLMWATDAPWIYQEPGYRPYTAIIDELLPDLTDWQREAIMGETARDFLRFPARAE